MANSSAALLLARQFKQMQAADSIPGISCGLAGGSVFDWEVVIMIGEDCALYGGELVLYFSSTVSSECWRFVASPLWKTDLVLGSSIGGVRNGTKWLILAYHRWILPGKTQIPSRVSSPATDDEVRDSHLPSQQYVH